MQIQRQQKLNELFHESQLLRWFTQMTLGLKYLHKQQIIHRDMKPHNVFLTKDKDLRIGDFGISKTLGGRSVVVEQTIGTPFYLSPEICKEKLYSFASDIWALGVILFELASLRVPFEAQNIPTLVKKITSGSVPQIPEAYSTELRKIISRLLQHDHTCRPTAADIVHTNFIRSEMHRMLREKHPSSTPPLDAMGSDRTLQQNRQEDVVHPKCPQLEFPVPGIRNASPELGSDYGSPPISSGRARNNTPRLVSTSRPNVLRQSAAIVLPSGTPRQSCCEKDGLVITGIPSCPRRPPSSLQSRPPSALQS